MPHGVGVKSMGDGLNPKDEMLGLNDESSELEINITLEQQ